jgi:hypothetical protein
MWDSESSKLFFILGIGPILSYHNWLCVTSHLPRHFWFMSVCGLCHYRIAIHEKVFFFPPWVVGSTPGKKAD